VSKIIVGIGRGFFEMF